MTNQNMPPWKREFSRFSDRSLREMKKYADNTNEEREWMCYVYDDNGIYELGGVSYGEESAIKVSPQLVFKVYRIIRSPVYNLSGFCFGKISLQYSNSHLVKIRESSGHCSCVLKA